jgi:RHS repeat-associated protein
MSDTEDRLASANDTAAAGTLSGDFAVSSDGVALYTIQLPLPPGTGGVAPRLSISYSSASGNDLLGMGCRLAGLSAITRTGATPAQDGFRGAVAYNDRDRFSLDGQRLVTVEGDYGKAGAVYHTEIETWRRVTTKYGATPGRVGPESFTVEEKDGRVLEYGGTPDSRDEAGAGNASVRVWHLSRVTDRNGNFMTVVYTKVDGQCLPARIDYTGHGSEAPRRQVRFEFQARPDATTHYVGGYPVRSARRLQRIEALVDNRKVLSYVVEYHAPGTTGRSRIKSVTQLDAADKPMSPTRFEWQDGDPRLLAATPKVIPTGLVYGGNFLPIDINGDGRVDFINAYRESGNLMLDAFIARGDDGDFDGPQRVAPTSPPLPFGGQLFPVDVDGDGRGDLVYAYQSGDSLQLTVFLSKAGPDGKWHLHPGTPFAGGPDLPSGGSLYPADVDGDGATDFVYVRRTPDGLQFTVLKSTGSGYKISSELTTSLPHGGICVPADAQGDGMCDLFYAHQSHGKLQIALLVSDGNALTLAGESILPAAVDLAFSGALIPMDLNGDGLVDLVHAGRAGSGGTVLTPLMSTGAGFAPQAAQTFEDIPFGAVLIPGQLNGDGMGDLVAAIRTPDGPSLRALLSTGSGFRAADAGQPLQSLPWGSLLALDLNGVGRSGLLNLGQAGGKLSLGSILPAGAAPDLVSRVTNGLGGNWSIRYQPITDSAVYSHSSSRLSPTGMLNAGSGATFAPSPTTMNGGTPAAEAPTITSAFPRYVVARYTKADGRGGSYEHRHTYADAALDLAQGRGWLGFRSETIVDADLGTTTTTKLRQDFPFAGMVESNLITRSRDGKEMTRVTLGYMSKQPYPRVRLPLAVDKTVDQFTFGRLDATQKITTDHDDFGNATQVADLGDGSGAALYTRHTYLNDTPKWRIGFCTGTSRSADAAGKQQIDAEQSEYDAATTHVRVHKLWHDKANKWLERKLDYDAYGNVTKETDPSLAVTTRAYDDAFHTFLAAETGPANSAGATWTDRFTHEAAFGNMVSRIDGNGVELQQRVDGFGRVTALLAPGRDGKLVEVQQVAWGSDGVGAFRETRDRLDWGATPGWQVTRDYMDGLERTHRTTTLAADGKTTVTVDKTFNGKNLVVRETLPYLPNEKPHVVTHFYDESGRIVRNERPADGGATRVDLLNYVDVHTVEKVEAAETPLARTTRSRQGLFNGRLLPVEVTDGGGSVSKIGYDAIGRLVRLEDAERTVTTMVFDSLDHEVSSTTTNGDKTVRSRSAEHDVVKRQVITRDGRGRSTTMLFDARHRPLTETDDRGAATTFRYDADGNGLGQLAAITLPDGAGYAFGYDAFANQTSIGVTVDSAEHKFARTFLPGNRLEQVTYPDGGTQLFRYTAGGMLESAAMQGGGAELAASIAFADFNASGKPRMLRYGNGVTEGLGYNDAGQLSTQDLLDAHGAALSRSTFRWNLLDDLTAIDDRKDAAKSYSFEYDGAGRLTNANGPYAAPQTYRYDKAGNLIEKAKVAMRYEAGLLVAAGDMAIGYDAAGHTTSLRGGGKDLALEYDARGRMTSGGGCTLTYSHEGRRLSKKSADGTVTWYVAPDYEVVQRPGGSRQHTRSLRTAFGLAATVTVLDAGTAVDPAKEPGIPAPGVCYFHRNQVNSTTVVTTGKGDVLAKVEYLPFGEISSFAGTDVFRRKFAGRELDRETGFYDFGARYYLPQIGRFLGADDGLGADIERHDAMNPYAYVLNSPACNVDPTGHNIFDTIGDAFKTAYNYLKDTHKTWVPFVVDGLLIIGGIAVLATTPFGGAASAMLGGMLLGAGLSGLIYNATHIGDKGSWSDWGIQLGIGGAVGLVTGGLTAGAGNFATAMAQNGRAAFALGTTTRAVFMAVAGSIEGAAGSALQSTLNNLAQGRAAGEGVGWAALFGAVTGALAGGAGARSAASSSRSRTPAPSEVFDRLHAPATRGRATLIGERVPLALSTATRIKDKTGGKVVGAVGKIYLYYAPQWFAA